MPLTMDTQYDKLSQKPISIYQIEIDNQSLKDKSLVSLAKLRAPIEILNFKE